MEREKIIADIVRTETRYHYTCTRCGTRGEATTPGRTSGVTAVCARCGTLLWVRQPAPAEVGDRCAG